MSLSQNAIEALKVISYGIAASKAFPLTNAAGGSAANREGLKELKAAGMAKTYNPADGGVMVSLTVAGKVAAKQAGADDFQYAGMAAAVDTEIVRPSILNAGPNNYVSIKAVKAEGFDAVATITVKDI